MTIRRIICDGAHRECCASCALWVENLQTPPTEFDRKIKPRLSGEHGCLDWKPIRDRRDKPEDAL